MDEKELAESLQRFEARMEERRAQGTDKQPREVRQPPLVFARWPPQRLINGRRIGF